VKEMHQDFSLLEGKRIIITGASRGLGRVCAGEFARQGARLVLLSRDKELLDQVCSSLPGPGKHLALPVDLSVTAKLHEAAAKSLDFLGSIDAVVHCAGGGLGLRNPLLSTSEFMQLLHINLLAPAELNRIIIPHMQKRRQGNIIHVGSIASKEAVASVGYNTAKAALNAYVRSVGREYAGHGLIITGILPGGFLAPGNSWERLMASKPEVVEDFIQKRLPRKKLGDAQELLPLLNFLASEQASMMAGCMVPIDAGEGISY
jgi:3-oxoacyl-[acyl-carrier protein] reductase